MSRPTETTRPSPRKAAGAAMGAALVAALLPAAARADWTGRKADDGALFYGIASETETGLALLCIGRSAGGRDPVSVGAHEAGPTPPLTLRLEIPPALLPPGGGPRGDVVLWADGTGYRLPPVVLDELDGVWTVTLAMTDPLIGAMRAAGTLVVGPEAGPAVAVPAAGAGEALAATIGGCLAEYPRMGLAVPPALMGLAPAAVPPSAPETGPRAAALAAVAQGCEGPGEAPPEAILEGDIDGDGRPDAVLNWDAVTCPGAMPRPFCGASMCAADVFLSSRPDIPREQLSLLAGGVSLVPLSNGAAGLLVGGSLGVCAEEGRDPCHYVWYWSGSDLVQAPPPR